MATAGPYKCYPSAAAGISKASSGGAAWSNSTYVQVVPASTITTAFYIAALTLMYSNNAAVDVSHEVEIDIATGAASSEVVVATVPFVFRIDTAAGHQPVIFLPLVNPLTIAANARISARIRQSLATTVVTYNGIKIFYHI
jgi:hypothetical protein